MRKQSFLQGALILMLAGLVNRMLGFVLRIIIVRTIGDEGLGLFQMIYPLFMTLLLISTAGFPVAISKLIPERMAHNDLRGSYNLLKISLVFTFLMSSIIIMIVYFSADLITTRIYSDSRTYIILLSILPALLISSLAACFRGFFQGMHTMMPTALSQITEQASRLLATLMIINAVAYMGLKYQAAGIAIGISIGELCGLLLLIILFLYTLLNSHENKKKLGQKISQNVRHNYSRDFKVIAGLAIPITMGRIINSLMMSGEAILIPRQLELSGLSISDATALYGQLSGMVEQVLFLPTVITIALTISLVPNISDAQARNNMKKIKSNYQDVIRISCYLGFPITVIFYRMGSDICNLLFGYPEAGQLLAAMAFASTFIYYLQVSHGMLNGLGKPHLSVINLSIGSLVKLIGIFYLTRQPIGIYGAAVSIGLGITLSALLNFISIGHNIGYDINIIKSFIKPFTASSALFISIPFLQNMINSTFFNIGNRLETILILLILVCSYLLLMIFMKAITREDLNRF
ncbi:MAG: oligosaccharide flippase family protein, partial [Halanaerobiales bacterium]